MTSMPKSLVHANPVDRAILQYQSLGESEALIQLFRPFLQEYVRLIYYQHIDYGSRQVRYFLSYFIGDKELRRQLRGNIFVSRACIEETKRVARFLHRSFSYEFEQEALHELIVVLLKVAKDYDESGSGFKGFVHTYYSRYLKSHLLSEEVKRRRKEPMQYAERLQWFEDEPEIFILKDLFEDEYFSLENEEDDVHHYRFISGENAGIFSNLTILQRRILIRYYIDKQTDSEIAKELAMHPGSVQRSRRKMYKTLWDQLTKGEIKCSRLNHQMISLDSFLNQEMSTDTLSNAKEKNQNSPIDTLL